LKLLGRTPVKPVTLPTVMVVGETPTSDDPLPALPGQAAASAAGSKLKLFGLAAADCAAGVGPAEGAAPAPAPAAL
jgi:hypothetical protein